MSQSTAVIGHWSLVIRLYLVSLRDGVRWRWGEMGAGAEGAGCQKALVPDGTAPAGAFCDERLGDRALRAVTRCRLPMRCVLMLCSPCRYRAGPARILPERAHMGNFSEIRYSVFNALRAGFRIQRESVSRNTAVIGY